ncbi:PLDc N-terminal domain-containing protein [Bacillus sp. FJAT-45037]|uniref:PLDc N-terminal domain-containing protein n=1 Tax=Bacillus sp. FJAT-45037 TaxID=2011007 RepID=UPI000C23ABF2|nr:PLDc N-terminal domain-containing protein [Bacillus sp. FJAT-45037]
MELLFIPLVFLLIFGGLILNVLTSVWCYKDSVRKGNSKEFSLLILIATMFFPVIGFIIYLFIRN